MQAKEQLASEKIKARVVSMPSIEEFEKQPEEYKQQVIPKQVKARVCVEAASHYAWYKYSGDYGEVIAMHTFGASGPAGALFKYFGFTTEAIVDAAKKSLDKVKND
jgi:transketolase